jgi:hypothetical protein
MLVLDKAKVAYLHINKTAGTSIRNYFTTLAGRRNVNQMGPTHGPLSATERILGLRFHDYNILVSIRNPFARVFSIYLFRKTRYLNGDISATTEAAYRHRLKPWFMNVVRKSKRATDFSISKSVLVDGEFLDNVHIVAVETLNQDMNNFCQSVMGLKTPPRLPHLNKTNYGIHHYTHYFDEELKQAVYEWDKWVIDDYYPWII